MNKYTLYLRKERDQLFKEVSRYKMAMELEGTYPAADWYVNDGAELCLYQTDDGDDVAVIYGLWCDNCSEGATTKRTDEAYDVYPVSICKDRYSGIYSGAVWTAFNLYEIPEGASGCDIECQKFWSEFDGPVGKGATPDEAMRDLKERVLEHEERLRKKAASKLTVEEAIEELRHLDLDASIRHDDDGSRVLELLGLEFRAKGSHNLARCFTVIAENLEADS